MAVTVHWDNGATVTWDQAVQIDQGHARDTYILTDEDERIVAMVPDFGVRFLELSREVV